MLQSSDLDISKQYVHIKAMDTRAWIEYSHGYRRRHQQNANVASKGPIPRVSCHVIQSGCGDEDKILDLGQGLTQ